VPEHAAGYAAQRLHPASFGPAADAPPTRYPLSAVGRLDMDGGWASGVLVGPRHVLTAAHVIPWTILSGSVAAASWIRFTPAAFDDVEPFGSALAVAVHIVQPADGPIIDADEERYDYAVCVLDRDIGRSAGWIGVHAYSDAWDGLPHWTLAGYVRAHACRSSTRCVPDYTIQGPGSGLEHAKCTPARKGQPVATRPTHQGGVAVDGHDDQEDSHQVLYHRADVHPGMSGGPLFGWWAGEGFPRAVAVQSWGWPGRAGASGGQRMVDLVIRARQEHPGST
jgi:hypothetical protein